MSLRSGWGRVLNWDDDSLERKACRARSRTAMGDAWDVLESQVAYAVTAIAANTSRLAMTASMEAS
jgi:hypothetical protein